jgi:flagellar hook assembly protein FlgD
MRIFDLSGRLVRTLIQQSLPAGPHFATWDRTDDRGQRVPGGVYFAQLRVAGRMMQRKVVMLK